MLVYLARKEDRTDQARGTALNGTTDSFVVGSPVIEDAGNPNQFLDIKLKGFRDLV